MKNEVTLNQVKNLVIDKIAKGEETIMSIHKKSGVAYHAIRQIINNDDANPKVKTLSDIYEALV